MIWEGTWPTYTWSDEEACRKMVSHYHLDKLVSFGKTKIFIKTPRTVYYLEEEREKRMPGVVSIIQFSFCAYDTHQHIKISREAVYLQAGKIMLSRLTLLDNKMLGISNSILFASFFLIL